MSGEKHDTKHDDRAVLERCVVCDRPVGRERIQEREAPGEPLSSFCSPACRTLWLERTDQLLDRDDRD